MSFIQQGSVYRGYSSRAWGGSGPKTHRYVLELLGDKVKYLQLDGDREGSVRTIKVSSLDKWAVEEVEANRIKDEWQILIDQHATGIDPVEPTATTMSVSTSGRVPVIVVGADLQPMMTVLFGTDRFLVVCEDDAVGEQVLRHLVNLDTGMLENIYPHRPYIVAQSKLTLSV